MHKAWIVFPSHKDPSSKASYCAPTANFEYVEDLLNSAGRRGTRFRNSLVLNHTRPFESIRDPVEDAVDDTELLPELLMQKKCGVVANILA